MRNPKWQCAYPDGKRIVFGDKFLTQWKGYHLNLIQTTGGTIGADRDWGYYGDVANLSYTANNNCYFNGWQTTGATATGNQIKFTNNDVSAKAAFIKTNPTEAYNNTTTGFTARGTTRTGYANVFDANPSVYKHKTFGDEGFVSAFSASVKNKNYFVLKYDCKQYLVDNGEFYEATSGITYDNLTIWERSWPVDLWINNFYPIAYNPENSNSILQHSTYRHSAFYVQRDYIFSGQSGSNITGHDASITLAGALHKYGRQHNWGELGTVTAAQTFYYPNSFDFKLSAQASGAYNNSGQCIENTKYNFNTWRTYKYVFNMNDYSLSAYDGSNLVYTRNTTNISAKNSSGLIPKMMCMFCVVPQARAKYHSDFNGTSDYYNSKGKDAFRNISFTYFNNCEEANVWAKNN